MVKNFDLTPLECEVLLLMTEGRFNQEIAYRLSVDRSVVDQAVGQIIQKLGARSRTEAALIAIRRHVV